MKMIVRMLCAAALVLGAASLTGCGDKKDDSAANKSGDQKKAVAPATTNAPAKPATQG